MVICEPWRGTTGGWCRIETSAMEGLLGEPSQPPNTKEAREMGVIMCPRCDKMIDLDYNVEEVITVGDEEICWTCATDEEQSEWEEHQ